MCIAILNKKGLITDAHLRNSWDNNYHGAGFAYSQGDRIFVYKNDKSVSKFIKTYKQHRKGNPDAVFLIHFRISTHGNIDETNLHPFVINNTVALIHNGMIELDGHYKTDERSDTRFLCEEILSRLPDNWHLSQGFHTMLEQLGGWSKFAMIDINNQYAIVNEKDGHWDESSENWYSNKSYQTYNNYVNYGGKMVNRNSLGKSSSSYSSSEVGDYIISVKDTDQVTSDAQFLGLIPKERLIYSVWASGEQQNILGKILNNYPDYSSAATSQLIKLNTWYSLPNSEFKGSVAAMQVNNQNYTIIKLNYGGAHSDYFAYYVIKGSPFDVHMAGEIIRTLADTSGKHTSFEARVNSFTKEPIASLVLEHFDKIEAQDSIKDDSVECQWCSAMVKESETNNVYGYTVCKDCKYDAFEEEIYNSRSRVDAI